MRFGHRSDRTSRENCRRRSRNHTEDILHKANAICNAFLSSAPDDLGAKAPTRGAAQLPHVFRVAKLFGGIKILGSETTWSIGASAPALPVRRRGQNSGKIEKRLLPYFGTYIKKSEFMGFVCFEIQNKAPFSSLDLHAVAMSISGF
jgi:hypothetical protein